MERQSQLLSRAEEVRALRRAEAFPQSARELDAVITRIRRRVIDFVARAPDVRRHFGNRRHRVLGADLHAGSIVQAGVLRRRSFEVGIYDYDRDSLVSVIVDLKGGRIESITDHPGSQPPPTPEEAQEAVRLIVEHDATLRRESARSLQPVAWLAREATMEGHRGFGHRVLEVALWRGQRQIRQRVLVDLSRRTLLERTVAVRKSRRRGKR